MEERIPEIIEELQDFNGKIISIKTLEGRGYVYATSKSEVSISFPELTYTEFEEESENDEEILSPQIVYKYIAGKIIDRKGNYWLKSIAANPEDVQNREAYMVIVLKGKDVVDGFEITSVRVYARIVEQFCGGWVSIPGYMTLDSHFFEMYMVPPELRQELNKLVDGRYIPDGFTIIGKSMPSDTSSFHPNPPYSAAENSGIRNVYWHNSITVNDQNIIEDIDISTYERETSMFQRPHLMSTCYYDYLEALLYIIDQYSDSEWAAAIK